MALMSQRPMLCGHTPLQKASLFGNLLAVRTYLNEGADPNKTAADYTAAEPFLARLDVVPNDRTAAELAATDEVGRVLALHGARLDEALVSAAMSSEPSEDRITRVCRCMMQKDAYSAMCKVAQHVMDSRPLAFYFIVTGMLERRQAGVEPHLFQLFLHAITRQNVCAMEVLYPHIFPYVESGKSQSVYTMWSTEGAVKGVVPHTLMKLFPPDAMVAYKLAHENRIDGRGWSVILGSEESRPAIKGFLQAGTPKVTSALGQGTLTVNASVLCEAIHVAPKMLPMLWKHAELYMPLSDTQKTQVIFEALAFDNMEAVLILLLLGGSTQGVGQRGGLPEKLAGLWSRFQTFQTLRNA